MKGKAIILAGGSGGLGSAVAEAIAARGGIPVIGCRSNRERAEGLSRSLQEKYGVQVPIVVGDILKDSTRQQLIDSARQAGTLYGLVPLVGEPARTPSKARPKKPDDSMRQNYMNRFAGS
jgi:short-subunit dehydrogenase